MERQGILMPSIKRVYFLLISKARAGKNYFLFFDIFLFFLTDLILSDQAEKDEERQGILRPIRKRAYFLMISQARAQKKNLFDLSIFFFIFLNRLKIIQSSRKRYGKIGNFKAFQKMGLLPTDIPSQGRKKLFSNFRNFS